MSDSAYVTIDWKLDPDVTIFGVSAVEGQRIHVDDLVKWAKARQKQLRRDIKRGEERLAAQAREREIEARLR